MAANSTNQTGEPDHVLQAVTAVSTFFQNYISLISVCFGLCGNSISVVVFWNRRGQDRASAGYLGPLAVFDFWNCIMGFYVWLVLGARSVTHGALALSGYASTNVGCYLVDFNLFFPMFMSGWIITAFTFERMLVVWFPLKMAALLSAGIRRKVILTLMVVGALVNGSIVFLVEVTPMPNDPNETLVCPPRADLSYALRFLFWFVLQGIDTALPCLCVAVLNVMILVGVFRASRKMDGKHSQNTSKNEKRCLRNLVAVSICYFIFCSPFALFQSLAFSVYSGVPLISVLTLFALSWINLNYSTNPLLYTWSLPYFRHEFVRIFTCGRRQTIGKKKDDSKVSQTEATNV